MLEQFDNKRGGTTMIVTYFICGLILFVTVLYYYIKRKYNYWKKKNVPHLKPSLVLGNYGEYILLKNNVGAVVKKLYDTFVDERYFGAYFGTEPVLVVKDPELIKLVMTKDYYYFNGREVSPYNEKEFLTRGIFFTSGDRWRVLRHNITPLFSGAKMKNMFYLIKNCTHQFFDLLENGNTDSNRTQVLEVKSLMGRFTMDCICSCIFGVEANTMSKCQENSQFTIMGNMLFENSWYRGFKNISRSVWPRIFYGFGFKLFPEELNYFFSKLLIGIYENRQYKPTSRNDFVDLLLRIVNENNKKFTGDSIDNMKTGGSKKVILNADDELCVAQCVILFAAGFETSATTLTFTLYELAKHEEAQGTVIKEVDAFLKKYNMELNYNCLNELPYLNACIDEALRLHPVVRNLTREVMEEYTFPTGLKVDQGVRVHIPVYALHHDPRLFPEPEQFRPERFLEEEKDNITPFTYMPFGEGHRLCIGMRLAKMMMISGCVTFFSKYHVKTHETTPSTIEIEPRTTVVSQPKGYLPLTFLRRKDI